MRHGKKINHLGRTSSHRKAMLSNMAASLILHKKIKTTTAKAKALRTFVEPLLTKSKEDSTHSRRVVFDYLQDKEAVAELFREVSPKIGDRPGGYTRILKTGVRAGDSADMCIIELVDFNEAMLAAKSEAKTGKRRRRGGKKKAEGEVLAHNAESTTEETANEVAAAATETAEDNIAASDEKSNEENEEKKES